MLKITKKYQKSKIVIGVSTGIDSMVLLNLLIDHSIIVAHINHNRRNESYQEQNYLKDFCLSRKIPFETITLNFTDEELKNNFQNLARVKRYQFFFEIIDKYQADYLALAHHGDDLIETVLMNISRGSSLKGYGAFLPESTLNKYKIIRPLIYYNKENILEYANSHKIIYFDDCSNNQDLYTRNRYRKNIIPFLKKENKNIHLKYLQYSKTIFDAYEIIEEKSNQLIDYNVLEITKQKKIIQYDILSKLLKDFPIELSTNMLDNIIDVLKSPHPNLKLNLSKNFFLVKEYDTFKVVDSSELTNDDYEIVADSFGIYYLPDDSKIIISENIPNNNYSNFKLCYNEKVFPIIIRNRKSGDKIKLTKGTKKVKDLLIDLKITITKRNTLPLIFHNDILVWIPTIRQAYQLKTNNCIYLTYEESQNEK